MAGHIGCFIKDCNNTIIGQCLGYEGHCGQFYCRTHSIGKLCSECGEREAPEAFRRHREQGEIEKHRAITATGRVSVFVVLDMKQFIAQEEDQIQFDGLRGARKVYAPILGHEWPGAQGKDKGFEPGLDWLKSGQERFVPSDDDHKYGLSREQVAFYTGIFEWGMVEEYPLYRVPKPYQSSQDILKDLHSDWDIYIRPTLRGLFVVRLSRDYTQERLSKIADDVQVLQEPSRSNSSSTPSEEKLAQKTVQQQLAKEVCWHFMQNLAALGEESQSNSLLKLECSNFDKQVSSDEDDLYNFYIVYYFKQLFDETRAPISGRAIRGSRSLQRDLALLIEGALLEGEGGNSKFPDYRQTYLDEVLAQDKSTWEDERHILTRSTAIIIPSQGTRDCKLRVIYRPAAEQSEKLVYEDYCLALERMLEFIVEVRFLAQVLERESWKACKQAIDEVSKIRQRLGQRRGNIDEGNLAESARWVASLSLLLSNCQEWSTPRTWSRAEYVEKKAEYLFEQMGVPLFLANTERNVNNKNALISDICDVYLTQQLSEQTELSESSAQQTSIISTTLSAASLVLVLFTLPAFLWYMHDRTLWLIKHSSESPINKVIQAVFPPPLGQAIMTLLSPDSTEIPYNPTFIDNIIRYITNWYLYESIVYIGLVIVVLVLILSGVVMVYGFYQLYKLRKNKKIAIK